MRILLTLAVLTVAACSARVRTVHTPPADRARDLADAAASITPTALLEHIRLLASDEFEGRAPGTRGETLTVEYLAEQFRAAGVAPGNPDGTYFQKVPLVGYSSVAALSVRTGVTARELRFGEDFVARSRRMEREVRVEASDMVFVGYGIVAPQFGWDDFKDVDVRGKTLLVLEGEPREAATGVEPERQKRLFRGTQTYFATRYYKFEIAAQRGAAAVLLIHDGNAAAFERTQTSFRRESVDIRPTEASHRVAAEGWLATDAFATLCREGGHDMSALRDAASRPDFRPTPLRAIASAIVTTSMRDIDSRNVVARVQGHDPELQHEHVIYTAHWDHLGRDQTLSGDQIFNGAIDNAAGTAQLLEIAAAFQQMSPAPRRSVLFIATTSEERGFAGARYYTHNPLYPLDDAVANINLDAGNVWGRTADLINMGSGLTTLDAILADAAERQKRTLVTEPFAGGSYFFLSDQIEFAKVGIPSVFPGSGEQYLGKAAGYGEEKWNEYGARHYHQVSDEVQPDWDLSGAAEDARWLLDAGWMVAQDPSRPEWMTNVEFRREPAPLR